MTEAQTGWPGRIAPWGAEASEQTAWPCSSASGCQLQLWAVLSSCQPRFPAQEVLSAVAAPWELTIVITHSAYIPCSRARPVIPTLVQGFQHPPSPSSAELEAVEVAGWWGTGQCHQLLQGKCYPPRAHRRCEKEMPSSQIKLNTTQRPQD